MKLSVNWLLELVDFNGSPSHLEDLLTRAGCKVESLEPRGAAVDHVITAEILSSERHPNADRLSVCQVSDGTAQRRQIVCGAKNYQVGDKVPLALPGAVLPGNFKIKVGKLRGVESEGMLCSAKELALAEDAVGLLILPKDTPIGVPISSIFPPDTILDLEITPNRGDWLSHLGIAREVSAFSEGWLKWAPPKIPRTTSDVSKVRIQEEAGCLAYSLRCIRGVRIEESPAWLSSKLEAVGLRPINNVVDITNYVMLLMGQPLHAFDAGQVKGKVVIRSAQEGEEVQTLEGKSHRLVSGDVVISDERSVLALGGIMGGEHSGVSSTTTEVLLESAVFDPLQIRRTSRRLGLSTESSYRFERGIDASMMLLASEIATQLMCDVAGGVADPITIVAGEIHSDPLQVTLRHERVNRLLGVDWEGDVIRNALKRIGLRCSEHSGQCSKWEIPGYRLDLQREVDLIEEVARILGIESIPEKQSAEVVSSTEADVAADFRAILQERLTGQGFFEARTGTLVNAASFEGFVAESKALRLRNPLGEEHAFLRPILIPGLLAAAQRNLNHGQKTVRLYEMGKVFRKGNKEEIPSLGMVMTGASAPLSWRDKEVPPLDFYDLKGVIEVLSNEPVSFVPIQEQTSLLSFPLGSFCMQVRTVSGQFLGLAGQLAPARGRALGVAEAVLMAELLLEPLQVLESTERRFSQIPRYPAIQRDIAVVVPNSVAYEKILETLLSAGEPLLVHASPFDVFSDPEKLSADCKSIAVALLFRSPERTLTNEEIAAAVDRLRKRLKDQLGAEFRE